MLPSLWQRSDGQRRFTHPRLVLWRRSEALARGIESGVGVGPASGPRVSVRKKRLDRTPELAKAEFAADLHRALEKARRLHETSTAEHDDPEHVERVGQTVGMVPRL